MKHSPPAHKSGTAGQIVNPILHNIHVDAGPLTAQIADYYDRRQHANTTQRGKLAAQLEREAVAEKAPKDVQATLPSVDWESRYNRLVEALTHACERADKQSGKFCCQVDIEASTIREIISENT